MSHHDENFRDEAGFGYILAGLIVAVAMPMLPATIGWSQYILG